MNPLAILTLLSELVERNAALAAENAKLMAELAGLKEKKRGRRGAS